MNDQQRADLDDVLNAATHLATVVDGFLDGRLTLKHLRDAALTSAERHAIERLWQALNG